MLIIKYFTFSAPPGEPVSDIKFLWSMSTNCLDLSLLKPNFAPKSNAGGSCRVRWSTSSAPSVAELLCRCSLYSMGATAELPFLSKWHATAWRSRGLSSDDLLLVRWKETGMKRGAYFQPEPPTDQLPIVAILTGPRKKEPLEIPGSTEKC